MNAKLLLSIIVLALAVVGLFLVSCQDDWCMMFAWQKIRAVHTFEDCNRLGFSVSQTYPPQCSVGSKSFTKDIGNEPDKVDLIRINWPRPGGVIKKDAPLLVEGEARGNWFFEASFPVQLKDEKGTVLAEGAAQAEGEWMTKDFVPYAVTLSFSRAPATTQGTLTLQKSNPSGAAEHDDALIIPLTFE